ncbi:MAG: hypothetical protein SCARUB_00780 [Candidatus Scalindua rubra]|uniref:PIN domain-containing protein n=1 Tax=Candidatus Scalindua rubra TaxID=1872076 RepID=A0A1E3XEP5_9BACT|nr:MAG: hypothetical protein SCARUB_00780 [Candidatus Scalindua rubra]
MAKESYIFDSHSLIKYFQKEEGFEKVVKLLKHIKKHNLDKYINGLNLGEVIYITKREFGDQKKLEILANIERLSILLILNGYNKKIFVPSCPPAKLSLAHVANLSSFASQNKNYIENTCKQNARIFQVRNLKRLCFGRDSRNTEKEAYHGLLPRGRLSSLSGGIQFWNPSERKA